MSSILVYNLQSTMVTEKIESFKTASINSFSRYLLSIQFFLILNIKYLGTTILSLLYIPKRIEPCIVHGFTLNAISLWDQAIYLQPHHAMM